MTSLSIIRHNRYHSTIMMLAWLCIFSQSLKPSAFASDSDEEVTCACGFDPSKADLPKAEQCASCGYSEGCSSGDDKQKKDARKPGSPATTNGPSGSPSPGQGSGQQGGSNNTGCSTCGTGNGTRGKIIGFNLGDEASGLAMGTFELPITDHSNTGNFSLEDMILRLNAPSLSTSVSDVINAAGNLRTITTPEAKFKITIIPANTSGHNPTPADCLEIVVYEKVSNDQELEVSKYKIQRSNVDGNTAGTKLSGFNRGQKVELFSAATLQAGAGVVQEIVEDRYKVVVHQTTTNAQIQEAVETYEKQLDGSLVLISSVYITYSSVNGAWVMTSHTKNLPGGGQVGDTWWFDEVPTSPSFGLILGHNQTDGHWERYGYDSVSGKMTHKVSPFLDTLPPAAVVAAADIPKAGAEVKVYTYPAAGQSVISHYVDNVLLKTEQTTITTSLTAEGDTLRSEVVTTTVFQGSYPSYGVSRQYQQSATYLIPDHDPALGDPPWLIVSETDTNGQRYDYERAENQSVSLSISHNLPSVSKTGYFENLGFVTSQNVSFTAKEAIARIGPLTPSGLAIPGKTWRKTSYELETERFYDTFNTPGWPRYPGDPGDPFVIWSTYILDEVAFLLPPASGSGAFPLSAIDFRKVNLKLESDETKEGQANWGSYHSTDALGFSNSITYQLGYEETNASIHRSAALFGGTRIWHSSASGSFTFSYEESPAVNYSIYGFTPPDDDAIYPQVIKTRLSQVEGPWIVKSDKTTSHNGEGSPTVYQERVTQTYEDQAGRVVKRVAEDGSITLYSYSDEGRTMTETLPNGSTRITSRFRDGRMKSITGTGVIHQYYLYQALAGGVLFKITSPLSQLDTRATAVVEDGDGIELTTLRRTSSNSWTQRTGHILDSFGRVLTLYQSGYATINYTLDALGNTIRQQQGDDRYDYTQEVVWMNNEHWNLSTTTRSSAATTPSPSDAVQQTSVRQSLWEGDLRTIHHTGVDGSVETTVDASDYGSLDRTERYHFRRQANPSGSTTPPPFYLTSLDYLILGEVVATDHYKVPNNTAVKSNSTTYRIYGAFRLPTRELTGTLYVLTGQGGQFAIHSQRSWSYDNNWRISATTDSANQVTDYEYVPANLPGAGKLSRILSPAPSLGATRPFTQYAYTALGERSSVSGTAQYPVSYTYSPYGELATQRTWRIQAPADGSLPATNTDSDLTSWAYDSFTGLVLSKTNTADGASSPTTQESWTYDPVSDVVLTSTLGNQTVNYAYDSRWRLISQSAGASSITYDNLDRPISIVDASGSRSISYGTDGTWSNIRYTHATEGPLSGYNAEGTGAARKAYGIKKVYDTLGRTVGKEVYSHVSTSGTDTVLSRTSYGYQDSTGLLSSVTLGPAGSTASSGDYWSRTNYDWTQLIAAGHPSRVTVSRPGTTTAPFTPREVLRRTRSADNTGRLTQQTWSTVNGSTLATITQDSLAYDFQGRISSISSEDGSAWAYAYNSRGELGGAGKRREISAGVYQDDPGRSMGYAYDAMGNRMASTETFYDPFTASSPLAGNQSFAVSQYQRGAGNQYTVRTNANPQRRWVLGRTASAATISVSTLSQPVSPKNTVTLDPIATNLHAGITAGTWVTTPVKRFGPNSLEFAAQPSFTLPTALSTFLPTDLTSPAISPAPLWKNVLISASTSSLVDGGLKTSVRGDLYYPSTEEQQVYDNAGRLMRDLRWTYVWDAKSQLIEMTSTTEAAQAYIPRIRLQFGYDHEGRRVSKKVWQWKYTAGTAAGFWRLRESMRFLYDGWNLVCEMKVTGDITTSAANPTPAEQHVPSRHYAWGLDVSGSLTGAGGVGGLVAVRQMAVAQASYNISTNVIVSTPALVAATYVPTYDHNGNVKRYMNLNTGTTVPSVAWALEYDAFGREITFTSSTGGGGASAATPPFRFSTKYTDAETTHVYYGYRYYSPEMGRWLSKDPIGERGGVNLYGFVANDGVNKLDVMGLKTINVNSCEVYIYIGHGTSTPITWNMAANSYGGVIVCNPAKNSPPGGHTLPSQPRHGDSMWPSDGGGQDILNGRNNRFSGPVLDPSLPYSPTIDPGDEHQSDKALANLLADLWGKKGPKKGHAMCLCGCSEVTLIIEADVDLPKSGISNGSFLWMPIFPGTKRSTYKCP